MRILIRLRMDLWDRDWYYRTKDGSSIVTSNKDDACPFDKCEADAITLQFGNNPRWKVYCEQISKSPSMKEKSDAAT